MKPEITNSPRRHEGKTKTGLLRVFVPSWPNAPRIVQALAGPLTGPAACYSARVLLDDLATPQVLVDRRREGIALNRLGRGMGGKGFGGAVLHFLLQFVPRLLQQLPKFRIRRELHAI